MALIIYLTPTKHLQHQIQPCCILHHTWCPDYKKGVLELTICFWLSFATWCQREHIKSTIRLFHSLGNIHFPISYNFTWESWWRKGRLLFQRKDACTSLMWSTTDLHTEGTKENIQRQQGSRKGCVLFVTYCLLCVLKSLFESYIRQVH